MVEGARLEILCTPCGYRGFKSLPLRQFNLMNKSLKHKALRLFCFIIIHISHKISSKFCEILFLNVKKGGVSSLLMVC